MDKEEMLGTTLDAFHTVTDLYIQDFMNGNDFSDRDLTIDRIQELRKTFCGFAKLAGEDELEADEAFKDRIFAVLKFRGDLDTDSDLDAYVYFAKNPAGEEIRMTDFGCPEDYFEKIEKD